ncbi:hypothetical protein CC78DRAFT_476888 [Lojkania enalia]|uniref:Fucose-specific lectin n=1 Tax=Lojkania enalia TaxID=147567 RepID=A0A9P4K068_9PLEO|nr:hypothetical protein CC78DRAFT_476888 [Didymosphaeria enalia]
MRRSAEAARQKELVGYYGESADREPDQVRQQTICGVQRKQFWILFGVVVAIILGAAIGGGIGGAMASRNKSNSMPTSVPTPTPNRVKSSPVLENSTLAAMGWVPKDGILRYAIYYQAKDGHILESAWDENSDEWAISKITDTGADIAFGTPLSANGGYPHTDLTWDFVNDVFFLGNDGSMYERQSPFKEQVGVWGNDNFSGQYSATNLSTISTYWQQDFQNRKQWLAVVFQRPGANSLNIAKYHSDKTGDYAWQDSRQRVAIQDGSSLAFAWSGKELGVRIYIGNSDGKLEQYYWQMDADSLTDSKTTAFEIQPHTPLCITNQDNLDFWKDGFVPECSEKDPYTDLILFASEDRKNLTLVSWNCSSGFIDQTNAIEPLLIPDRTYVSLASVANGTIFVLFDAGDGPELEQWKAPSGGTHSGWKVVGSVPVKLPDAPEKRSPRHARRF